VSSQGKSKWEFWASIPPGCEPHLAMSSDDCRPVLCNGWIRHEDDGPALFATDSYIAVRIPITLRTETEADRETVDQRKALLPECVLPRETMEALAGATHFRIVNGRMEIQGKGALYPISLGLDAVPDLSKIHLENCPGGQLGEIRINPVLLSRVAKSIGAESICLKFTAPLNAVDVRSDRSSAKGMLMPMRDGS
jgi:hypothetical protein